MTTAQAILAVAGVIGLALFLALCFLPSIIAMNRGKKNWVAIFALNLLCGWTGIGWIAALVWSLTYEEPVGGLDKRTKEF